ncbi:unnamed protein product [Caretta caretta]
MRARFGGEFAPPLSGCGASALRVRWSALNRPGACARRTDPERPAPWRRGDGGSVSGGARDTPAQRVSFAGGMT